ncbi:hypothetical protein GOBAR_AA11502 [Gossypium barbadense]|uniref:Piwi domain-containing protein n=1 Tax=Gossypium barbadense TaxID=3634 RepID=A0A2P5Y0K7_GOSBA|nr:hypothetical protein GOBAR_AA11502 [Gossypium barbadense]
MLMLGQTPSIPVVSKIPTIILGMGALLGFPEQFDVPSIAAMILSSKLVSDKMDDGIMKEALLDFYTSSGKRKPDQIIIFRDGQGSPDNVLHGTVIDNKTTAIFIKGAPQPYLLWLLFATFIWQLHSWGHFMKIRDASETSSSHGGMYAPRVISVPQLSRLKDKVSNFILVC